MSRRRLAWSGTVLVMAVIVVAVVLWSRSSNQVVITNNGSAPAKPLAAGPQLLTNDYFSFSYPGTYHVKSQAIQLPDLADYLLQADTSYTKQLSVTLLRAEPAATSAYIYRQTRSDLYTSQPITINGNSATVWTKNDGNEQTAFLSHNGLTAILSFSVQNTNANSSLTAELNSVLSTFQWH